MLKHEIRYEKGPYFDILKDDDRYDPRAYDFMLDVIQEAGEAAGGQVSGRELLDVFRDFVLDSFGPMSYTVLTDWGLNSCEDVGEVVFNLYDSKRISKTDTDSREDFIGGFDFEKEFREPFL